MTTGHAPVGQRQPAPPSSGEVAGSSPARALHPGQCPACPEVLPSLGAYADHRFDFHHVLSARAVEEWEAATVQRLKAAAAHAKGRAPETPGAAAPPARVVTKTFGGQAVQLRVPAPPPDAPVTDPPPAAPPAPGPAARKERSMPKHACPEKGCAATFASPQGVGPHRAKVHGYRRPGRLPASNGKPARPRGRPPRRPKRATPPAAAAVATSPATTGAVLTALGNGLDLDSLRQAHALCEQRAQQYTESAQNLKAILLLETALATATAAPPTADGKAD